MAKEWIFNSVLMNGGNIISKMYELKNTSKNLVENCI